ncbi:MAG: flagellar biosynthesis protein FlhF [Ignavibacteriae bacterium]|nr:MAG: flagellar biosynthesis protein FlhF [Ignavibacteriota bacterium]
MQIKKFTAKTLKQAIAEMKKEFGEEAIVLSTKVIDDYKDGLEQKYFEITASIDEDDSKDNFEERKEESKVENFQTEMKKLTERIYGVNSSDASLEPRTSNNKKTNIKSKKVPKLNLDELKKELLKKDIKPSIVRTILEKVVQYEPFINETNKEEYIISILSSLLPTSQFELSKGEKTKIITLVGPTGVGKTTCIAKLAVISKILHNLDIGLISIDTYRLGALDQLKIFSEISNIDFLVAYEPGDIPKFMKKFKDKDIVFIDTVGRSQQNEKQLESINTFLDKVKVDETYLVLNSTSDFKVMFDVATKFKKLNYNSIVFSKLDEAVTYGNILNLVNKVNVPIKYLTNGQVIPDDIISADVEFIANMIYSGKIS